MNGRPIVVPDSTILSVLSELSVAYREETGDIYGTVQYPLLQTSHVPKIAAPDHHCHRRQRPQHAGDGEHQRKNFPFGDTVLGDFNNKGLRAHAPLTAEIDNTRRLFQFNMNY